MSTIYRKSGFTLIELLVVIAIIAILAAILFPVFAQAREKARQASCMSNEQQMALGVLQYTQDYDEVYPFGLGASWYAVSWDINIQPYVKNLAIFECPDDGDTLVEGACNGQNGPGGWCGVGISYASNGYVPFNPASPNSFPLHGIMGMSQPWLVPNTTPLGKVNFPATTVMITEKHNADCDAYFKKLNGTNTASWGIGNSSIFGAGPIIAFDGCITGFPGHNTAAQWDQDYAPNEIPDGSFSQTAAYPCGANGSVSADHQQRANFAFADGHVHAEFPYNTDTNSITQPGGNEWDAYRSTDTPN